MPPKLRLNLSKFDGFDLPSLEASAVAFLDYAETLGRPLLQGERKSARWLLVAFECRSVRRECAAMPQSRLRYYSGLIESLRSVVEPDPVRQPKFQRNLDGVEARTNHGTRGKPGEPALELAPLERVHLRNLNAKEVVERIELLTRCCDAIGVIVRELGHAMPSMRKQSRWLRCRAKSVAEAGVSFVGGLHKQDVNKQDQKPKLVQDVLDFGEPEMDAESYGEMKALRDTPTGGSQKRDAT